MLILNIGKSQFENFKQNACFATDAYSGIQANWKIGTVVHVLHASVIVADARLIGKNFLDNAPAFRRLVLIFHKTEPALEKPVSEKEAIPLQGKRVIRKRARHKRAPRKAA